MLKTFANKYRTNTNEIRKKYIQNDILKLDIIQKATKKYASSIMMVLPGKRMPIQSMQIHCPNIGSMTGRIVLRHD